MTGWRRNLAIVVAAVAGLVVAAGLTTAASTLSDQSVGLSSEPLTAGGGLAPAETVSPSPTPTRSATPSPTRSSRPTSTPEPTRTAVDDDHSAHGVDDDCGGHGSGRGRGRGDDD
jgi:hypothetical protein